MSVNTICCNINDTRAVLPTKQVTQAKKELKMVQRVLAVLARVKRLSTTAHGDTSSRSSSSQSTPSNTPPPSDHFESLQSYQLYLEGLSFDSDSDY